MQMAGKWRSPGFWSAVGGVAMLLMVAAISAHRGAEHLGFNPINGHFQNFNALARLAAGQRPFVDFPVYLGLGPLLLPFPIFLAFGSTLSAANLAGDLVSVLLLGGSLVVLLRLVRMPHSLSWPLAACIASLPWPMARGHDSAIGIRSFLPFAAALVFLGLRRWHQAGAGRLRFFLVAGAAAGLMPLWSNDYGLPSALAFSLSLLVCCHRGWEKAPVAWACYAMGAIASLVLALCVVTAGHPAAWLAFNQSVAADQFWFYNPMAAAKVYSLADIPHGVSAVLLVGPNLALWLRWLLYRRDDNRAAALAMLAAAATGGAVLSGLAGTFELRYMVPLQRVTLVTLPFCLVLAARPFRHWIWPQERGVLLPATVLGFMALPLAVVFFFGFTAKLLPKAASGELPVAELGGLVPSVYQPAIEMGHQLGARYDHAGIPANRRLLSTYATATALLAGSRQEVPDYIIHALGDAGRQGFAAGLNAGYANVETIDPDAMMWGRWNMRTSWPFYRVLLRDWEPVSRTPWSLLWARRASARVPGPSLACHITTEEDGFTRVAVAGLPQRDGADWWAEVVLDVATHFKPGMVPLVGDHRLLELVENRDEAAHYSERVTWAPTMMALVSNSWTGRLVSGEQRYPLRLIGGQGASLSLRAWPRDRAGVEVRSCHATALLPVAEATLPRTGPRGGEIALVSFSPPEAEAYPVLAGVRAFYLEPVEPLAHLRTRPGDTVVFPDGQRSTLLMSDLYLAVAWRPELRFSAPVDHITIVPRKPDIVAPAALTPDGTGQAPAIPTPVPATN